MTVSDILTIIQIVLGVVLFGMFIALCVCFKRYSEVSEQNDDKIMLITLINDFEDNDKLTELYFTNSVGTVQLRKREPSDKVAALGFHPDDEVEEDHDEDEE